MSASTKTLRQRVADTKAQLKKLEAELDHQDYEEIGEDIRTKCPDGKDHDWRAIEWTHEIVAPPIRDGLGVVRGSGHATHRRGGKWVCHCAAEMTIR